MRPQVMDSNNSISLNAYTTWTDVFSCIDANDFDFGIQL